MRRWLQGWSEGDVAPGSPAGLTRRTYLESADVRDLLGRAATLRPLERACDVGCGYGRLTAVLSEFAATVAAFEREPDLARLADRLNPDVTVHHVSSLERLPVPDHTFDLALVFTVLQHLADDAAERLCLELRRVVQPGGFVVLCEETNESRRFARARGSRRTRGRSPATYTSLLGGAELVVTTPRRVEPTYPRRDVGAYMLFRM